MEIPIFPPPEVMHEAQISDTTLMTNWAEQIIRAFRSHQTVVVSTTNPIQREKRGRSDVMISNLSTLIEMIYRKVELKELVIEGGATASSIVRRLGWNRLIPWYEFDLGVVALSPVNRPDSVLVVKPGSYTWPDSFLVGIDTHV